MQYKLFLNEKDDTLTLLQTCMYIDAMWHIMFLLYEKGCVIKSIQTYLLYVS